MNPETPASPSPALALRSLSVGPMDNNAYLLTCRATGAQLLIDAAAEPERLLALVAEGAADGPAGPTGASPNGGEAGSAPAGPARLERIVTTHRHHDHIGALAAVVAATGARTAAGAEDAESIREQTGIAIDEPLAHGDRIRVGAAELEVIALRGHTPGSIALLWRGGEAGDHLFTGDSLFPGGVGNTQQDPERFAQLLGDVEDRVFAVLPDATAVHPGHGAPTTLGAERPELPAWRARGW
ncbi:MBL fold metallo-hydrolase [Brachybacterium sp. J144]|uniref:MBL fold metallo-hydrolase n=1 Tax=Brachybacterium sp. J144 TaxID=3116487 RepID=UPI002E795EDB|nr:MBL fold metallo-hydrolase [Brachybacterium sp. J144]MEE1651223.1 MBL fold metallo-hydrolase [Brachybacterium sp. J144]